MVRAFDRDFERNGPSTIRIVAGTTLAGWKRYKNHPDPRIRRRYAWGSPRTAHDLSAVVGGAKLYYRGNPEMHAKTCRRRSTSCTASSAGSRGSTRRWASTTSLEDPPRAKRLAAGWTYEPPTFYEKNDACVDVLAGAARCRCVAVSVEAAIQGGQGGGTSSRNGGRF